MYRSPEEVFALKRELDVRASECERLCKEMRSLMGRCQKYFRYGEWERYSEDFQRYALVLERYLPQMAREIARRFPDHIPWQREPPRPLYGCPPSEQTDPEGILARQTVTLESYDD